MSRVEAAFGLAIMEKLIGIVVMLIGILVFYVAYTNINNIGSYPSIFLVAGLILIGLGIIMVIVKTE